MDAIAKTPTHLDNRLLASLSAEEFSSLGRDLRQIDIPQGRTLYKPGDPIEEIYFPQSGLISLLVVTEDGGQIETSTVGREGAVGLHRGFGERCSFTHATVQIAGRFSIIHGRPFERLVQSSTTLRHAIGRYTEILWAETQQVAACNAAHEAKARICRWLLQSADKIGSEFVPFTQEFLAQMLGTRRTTVTLLAQLLQESGIIKYSRGKIQILDRKKLEEGACECYRVLRYDKLRQKVGIKY